VNRYDLQVALVGNFLKKLKATAVKSKGRHAVQNTLPKAGRVTGIKLPKLFIWLEHL
jgi:hypothetical protein